MIFKQCEEEEAVGGGSAITCELKWEIYVYSIPKPYLIIANVIQFNIADVLVLLNRHNYT